MKILNTRFTKWVGQEKMLHEEQDAYNKVDSTVDQIFVLQSLIQKYVCKPKLDRIFY